MDTNHKQNKLSLNFDGNICVTTLQNNNPFNTKRQIPPRKYIKILHITIVQKSLYNDHLQVGWIRTFHYMFQGQQHGDPLTILDNLFID
jgi:hypothetical protein